MASKPIVATDISGNNEGVQNAVNGFLVPTKEPEQLALALERLILNWDLRKTMGQASRERVMQNYTEEKMADDMADLYKTLLSKKGEVL